MEIIVGSIVKDLKDNVLGEVIDVLPNSLIIETGIRIVIRSKHQVKPFLSPGDQVFVYGTNITFRILSFYFSDKYNSFKAIPEAGCDGAFHDYDINVLETEVISHV